MEDFDYKGYVATCHLKKGDVIDIVSDMLNLGFYAKMHNLNFSPDKLIDAFKDAVGQEGTVMIRTFNWDFCHGVPFNIKKTPSKVGALGNFALKRQEFKRTKHPLYSWMVWGKYQKELCALNDHDAFGKGSVFEWEANHECYMIHIGEPQTDGRTIFHFCEQRNEVPYRYKKFWKGEYIDECGNITNEIYSMTVRDLNDATNPKEFVYDGYLIKSKATKYYYYNDLVIYIDDIPKVIEYYDNDMKNNFPCLGLLGHYGGYTKNLRDDVCLLLQSKYPEIDFRNTYQLVDSGKIVESDIEKISNMLEKHFSISIPHNKRDREHFNSYESITALVGSLRTEILNNNTRNEEYNINVSIQKDGRGGGNTFFIVLANDITLFLLKNHYILKRIINSHKIQRNLMILLYWLLYNFDLLYQNNSNLNRFFKNRVEIKYDA